MAATKYCAKETQILDSYRCSSQMAVMTSLMAIFPQLSLYFRGTVSLSKRPFVQAPVLYDAIISFLWNYTEPLQMKYTFYRIISSKRESRRVPTCPSPCV
jgi:hypothetical protein